MIDAGQNQKTLEAVDKNVEMVEIKDIDQAYQTMVLEGASTTKPESSLSGSFKKLVAFSMPVLGVTAAIFYGLYGLKKRAERMQARENSEKFAKPDAAVLSDKELVDTDQSPKNHGGIDLNPTILSTEIKRTGRGVIIPTFKGEIPDFNGVEGFVPNIMNVTPINNLMLLLGIAEPNPQKEKSTEVSYNLSFLPIESRREF